MDKTDCRLERVSNVLVGLVLMMVGLIFTLIGLTFIPVIGLLIAIPVLILAGVFLASPRSKACAALAQKTRSVLNS
jgi:hypothetical protein